MNSAHTLSVMSKPGRGRAKPKLEVSIGAVPAVAVAKARDLEHAMNRIGGPDARARAKWLVETFLYEDPDSLSTGSRLDRQQELAALVIFWMSGTGVPLGSSASFSLGAEGELAEPEALRNAWRLITENIHRWASGQPIFLPSVTMRVELASGTGKDLRARIVREGEGLDAMAQAAAFDLLVHPDVRVRSCDVCGQLFVPIRRQERHERCARQLRDSRRPDRGKKPKKGTK
jgi:hypothetical protein